MSRREKERLTAEEVANAKPGKYCDGGGLWLYVRESGSKSWVYRFMLRGKSVTMGLGSTDDVSLETARDKAREYHKLLKEGSDPRAARALSSAKTVVVTFREDAESYLDSHESGWSPGHFRDSRRRLELYAYPIVLRDGRRIANVPVGEIDTAAVLAILNPIWGKSNPTARLVRLLLEDILDFARILGHRNGENPARWKGHLKHALPKPGRVHKRKHRPALPYRKVPAFLSGLLGRSMTVTRSALEFDIYAPVRIGVVVGAEWEEFDPQETSAGVQFADRWTIPEDKMKGYLDIEYPDVKYEVPLSRPMVNVLERMWLVRESDYVFPATRDFGKHLHETSVLRLAKRLTKDAITTHGFRSSFTSWADDVAFVEDWVKEMCLGHSLGTETEKAYRRADLFEKRRLLMEAWSEFLASGKVAPVNIRARFMKRFAGDPILMMAEAAD